MKSNLYRIGIAGALLILLGGSIIQTLGGTSGFGSVHAWGSDDAFISYRYAENFVHGKGLVFNSGERVEGYSNFLYVLLMAPAFWVTNRDGVYFYSVFVNLACAVAAFLIFTGYLRRELGEGSAVAGGFLLSLSLPLWIAVSSGMETFLVLLLSIAIWVSVERVAQSRDSRYTVLLCILMILSLLARADGFLVPAMAILYVFLKRGLRLALTCALPVLAAFGLYEVWRYQYYGYLLPNTYYVKVVGPLLSRARHALDQLRMIALVGGLLAYLLTILFVLIDGAGRVLKGQTRISEELRFDNLFAVGWIAYWFYIGGDHFLDRFLLILFPLGIFALLKYLSGNANKKVFALVVALVAALEVGPSSVGDPRFQYFFDKYDCWVVAGKFIGEKYPGKSVATGAIGKIPFFSGAYTVDMLGLIDPVIAHRPVESTRFEPGHMKTDPDYILSRKADVIADWIYPDGDLYYGLSKSKVATAGYQIEYLVNTQRMPPPARVIGVSAADEASIKRLVDEGYNFALLVKK